MKNQEQLASEFINAIKTISTKENNLQNFQNYLSNHFEIWLQRFANTPEDITAELKEFAKMEI